MPAPKLTKVHDMKARRAELIKQARASTTLCDTENRDQTADEKTSVEAALAEIKSLGEQIESRELLERYEAQVGHALGSTSNLPNEDPANKKHSYSVLKVIRQQLELRDGGGRGVDGLEREVHQELLKRKCAESKNP